MKKIILLFCLLYWTIDMMGQVRVLPDKVGVGTENPETKLQIVDGSDADSISG